MQSIMTYKCVQDKIMVAPQLFIYNLYSPILLLV